MRHLATFALSALLLVLGAADLSAQLGHRQIVVAQMSAGNERLAQDGYAPDPGVLAQGQLIGMVAKESPIGLELQLVKGNSYLIIGTCDYDCTDMDLRLRAPDDKTFVAEDLDDDDSPVLAFRAPETGTYLLLVSVSEAKETYVYFGLQVLKK